MRRLQRLLLIHEGEGSNVIYFLFFFLVVSAGMAIGRSTADALFFKRFGIEYLPVMYMIQSLLLAVVSTLYAAFADRVSAESFFKVLFVVLALLVGTSWLVISHTGSGLIYPVYYLIYEVASELLLVHATLYMSQNLNTLQAKRLSPLIYAGAQTGTIIGGLALVLLAPVIGTQNLILVWCFLLATGIAALVIRHKHHGVSTHFRPPRKTRNMLEDALQDIKQGVRYTAGSDLLRAASLALFFMVIAFYILCYSVNRVYTQTFETEEALTGFFGGLTAATSTIALLSQIFITNRVIHALGVRRINLLFPVTTLASLITLAFSFTLPSALLGSINKDAIMPAFRNPIRTIFFSVLPGYIQGRARAISIAIVLPAALFICGGMLWIMLKIEDTRIFVVAGCLAAICYLVFNLKMNRAYVSTLLSTLKERLFLPSETMYSELHGSGDAALREVMRGVHHPDNKVAIAYTRVLVKSFPDAAADAVLERIRESDLATTTSLVELLAPIDLSGHTQQLTALEARGDDHLKAVILHILIEQGDTDAISRACDCLASDNPRLRVIGLCAALRDTYTDDIETAWLELLNTDFTACLAALDLIPDIHRIPDERKNAITAAYEQAVIRLFGDQPPDIQARMLKGMAQWPGRCDSRLGDRISRAISGDNPELRVSGAACLHLLPGPQRDELALKALEDGHFGVRKTAVSSLRRADADFTETSLRWISENLGSPRAQETLLQALQEVELPTPTCERIASQKVDVAQKIQDALSCFDACPERGSDAASVQLLRHTLNERMEQTIQLALLALEPLHEPGTIGIIRAGFSSGDVRHAANACEALSSIDNRYVASRLNDMLQHVISKHQTVKPAMTFGNLQQVLEWSSRQNDEWLSFCATRALQQIKTGATHA